MSETRGTHNTRRLARARGYYQEGRYGRAAAVCKRILKDEPDNIGALCLAAVLRFASGDRSGARAMLADARARDPSNPQLVDTFADLCARAGDYETALRVLREALAADPACVEHRLRLGEVLEIQGEHALAVAAYRKVLDIQPEHLGARLKMAASLKGLGEVDAAIAALEQALRLPQGKPEAAGMLAELYEQLNRVEEAAALAQSQLARAPGDPQLSLVAARCLRRRGQFREALGLLDGIKPQGAAAHERAAELYERGTLLDRLEQPEAAILAFEQANAIVAQAWHEAHPEPNTYARKIAQLRSAFTPALVRGWAQSGGPPPEECPTFLVGFPRSGTTLLDQVLDSHPGTQVLEERGLAAVLQHELSLQGPFPQILANLDTAGIQALRDRYYSLAKSQMSLRSDRLLIDKLPLNITNAGLIFRVFPNARFIFAVRHPADVCLSCFMQNFRPTDAMANFFSLASSVDFYVAAMSLWTLYRERLPLTVHTIRYEDLIGDFEGQTRALLGYLGLDWHESIVDFHKHAKRRARINTPSYHQVSQPLYASARFRWHRYRDVLEPFMPRLAPWITAFGYDDAEAAPAP